MLDKILSRMIRWNRTQMKGTQTMSKVSTLVKEETLTAEDFLSGPQLTGPESTEPSPIDWAIAELNNAIGTLEKDTGAETYGYIKDLKNYRKRLQDVIEKALKPF